MVKKVFLDKRTFVLLLLIFIMLLSGNSYAWISFASDVGGGTKRAGELKINASLVKINDLAYDSDSTNALELSYDVTKPGLSYSYKVENSSIPLDENDTEDGRKEKLDGLVPLIFKFDLSGKVLDEEGNPIFDGSRELSLMDFVNKGFILVEYEDEDGFISSFNDESKIQKAWLEDINSDDNEKYCFLMPGEGANVKVTFRLSEDIEEPTQYEGFRILPVVTFFATRFKDGAVENRFGVDNFREDTVVMTVGEIPELQEESELDLDDFDSFYEENELNDVQNGFSIDHNFVKLSAQAKSRLSDRRKTDAIDEMSVVESSPWNPRNPGNEVYRQLLDYLK